MRWPWVSRAAFEAVISERDRLRDQNDDLVDQLTRVRRVEAGMPEAPRPEKAPIEAIPHPILEYCNGFAHPGMRKEMRDTVLRRHQRGESWIAIQGDIMGQGGNE